MALFVDVTYYKAPGKLFTATAKPKSIAVSAILDLEVRTPTADQPGVTTISVREFGQRSVSKGEYIVAETVAAIKTAAAA